MLAFLLSGFVFFTSVQRVLVEFCEADSYTDGCSVPFGLDTPFKEIFTKACNKHDTCYGCGYHFNWSRALCDAAFLRDMKNLCRPPAPSRKRRFVAALMELWDLLRGISKKEKRCRMMADVYYDGVRMFGESHYANVHYAYCYTECAKLHGSPFVTLKRRQR
ncbi:conodipine-P1-like [Xenia sp. Carnegie-2017]|uniref:conodipine-P1-like n=1 Tax=Xenia sp. Carnegie-2017 TaxID=2897299 RepID=UPI001F04273C|nr:conodipine-P1-like [Xenia sp. Carnegie-2017]